MNAHNEQQSIIAGALFDLMGYLTCREKKLHLSASDDAAPAVEALTEWAERRGFDLDEARVTDWQAALAAQPSPVVKQNLTTQPVAAQEAAGWQVFNSVVGAWQDASKSHYESRKAHYPEEARELYAAPVTAAPWIDLAPRPMATAPRDGTMLRLLVQFDDHATEDTEGPAWTIGHCSKSHPDDDDNWQFAGWCWDHDHFTEGKGTPVGWLPLIDASPKGDDVPHRDLVPGVMRCAKCAFQLHRTNLYLGSGTTGPGDSKTEPCPNGCGPLWPVTWQTWATEGWQQAERYFEELRQLQDSPKGGSEARALLDALVSLVAVARRYLPDYDEHPEVQKADDAIDAAMQGQAGDAEVQP